MNIFFQFILLATLTSKILASIPSTTGYISGSYSVNGQPTPTLWLTDLAGNAQNAIELKNPDGSRATVAIAYSVYSVFNRLYIGGRDGYNNENYPSLWISDLAGNAQNAIELKNPDGSSANGGYAFGITSLSNTLYIVGYDNSANGFCASLWISDLNGNAQNAIELKKPDGSIATATSYPTTAITTTNTLYMAGRYITNSITYPALWISDLAGNAQNAIELKNPDGSDAANGVANSMVIFLDTLYIVGQDGHDNTYYPSLWISDLAGNAQNAIELKNPDGSNAPNGEAAGVTAFLDKLYIVGRNFHNSTFYPCLWITDLAGNIQNTIELKNPDGSDAASGIARDVKIFSNELYIVGDNGRGGTTYPSLWISDLAGNADPAIELKNPEGSSAPEGRAEAIHIPIPLPTQVIEAANYFNTFKYLKKSL